MRKASIVHKNWSSDDCERLSNSVGQWQSDGSESMTVERKSTRLIGSNVCDLESTRWSMYDEAFVGRIEYP